MSDSQIGAEGLISLSENAAKRIAFLKTQEGDESLALRIAVNGGGCSGFTYQFSFDANRQDDDLIVKRNDAELVIDPMSVAYLAGSEVDYVEDLVGSFFNIRNPNATAACGCGASFAIG
jgi:iron-sulfur cluster insertion protein